jgi:adenosylcobyric acid synthase
VSILFLGTASGAGKTTVAAMYCRHLYRKGARVAPFKALNLSLNSFVTPEGKEIGMGQAFQAWASGIEPSGDMNPALLKPSGNGKIQLVLGGAPAGETSRDSPMDFRRVMGEACAAFDRLSAGHAVVCEGSGSPVELNLMHRDVANLGMMRERSVPAVLVGDIERGGAFAALYGTWLLTPDDLKPLLKGFIINRFRGDAKILEGGIRRIEELTGMRFLGVLPYARLKFPEEDSLSDSGGDLRGSSAMEAFIGNIDALLEMAESSGLDFAGLDEISGY